MDPWERSELRQASAEVSEGFWKQLRPEPVFFLQVLPPEFSVPVVLEM